MMEKVKTIVFKTSDGESWGLPKSVIADNRAKHYAENDSDTTYESEFEFTMNDDYEAIDWLQNNMNASEYESALFRITPPMERRFIDKFNDDEGAAIDEKEFVRP